MVKRATAPPLYPDLTEAESDEGKTFRLKRISGIQTSL